MGKVQLMLLLLMALLVGFVRADRRRVLDQMTQAYMGRKDRGEMDSGSMQPEMAQDQPEMMATGDDDGAKMMDPASMMMMEQSPPGMMGGHERDNRYNPYYGQFYYMMPYRYGTGMYPRGGGRVVYVNDPMAMDMNEAMYNDDMPRYVHPNLVSRM